MSTPQGQGSTPGVPVMVDVAVYGARGSHEDVTKVVAAQSVDDASRADGGGGVDEPLDRSDRLVPQRPDESDDDV